MPVIHVAKLVQTCISCPSQWEGTTTGGDSVYVRYRNGMFRVEVEDKTIIDRAFGREFDGDMSYAQLKALCRGKVKFP